MPLKSGRRAKSGGQKGRKYDRGRARVQKVLVASWQRYSSILLNRDRHSNRLRQVRRCFEHGRHTSLRIRFEDSRADRGGLLGQDPQLIRLAWGRHGQVRRREDETSRPTPECPSRSLPCWRLAAEVDPLQIWGNKDCELRLCLGADPTEVSELPLIGGGPFGGFLQPKLERADARSQAQRINTERSG